MPSTRTISSRNVDVRAGLQRSRGPYADVKSSPGQVGARFPDPELDLEAFGCRVPRVSDLASNRAVDLAVVEPSPGRRPAAPPRHLYGDDRAAGRLHGVLVVLVSEGCPGQGHLAWVVGHPSAAVQPDPPQHRPVLA